MIRTIALCLGAITVAAMLPATVAQAATKTWTGGTGNWSVGANWNGGSVPLAGDIVNIALADGVARTVTYNVNAPALGLLSIDLTGAGLGASTLSIPGANNLSTSGLVVGGFNGAAVTNGRGALVQSAGTVTTSPATGDLILGWGFGSTGAYTLSGGALVNSLNEYVGLSGTGTFHHSGGTNTINANATGSLILGTNVGSTGTYNLSGTGALTTATDQSVGNSGAGFFNQTGGTNTITGAGRHLYIGRNASGVGFYNISGTASLSSDGDINIGNDGAGTLAIQTGGSVSNANSRIARIFGSTGTATVNGSGSTWANSDQLQVGRGGTGSLRIEAGGSVSNTAGFLGVDPDSSGTATVTGVGSTWANSAELLVGSEGTGTLRIEAGGSVSNTTGFLAGDSDTSGTATVTGAGSTWTNSAELVVGSHGMGTLRVEAGGSVSNTTGFIGFLTGSNGTVTVTGAGATWNNSSIYVGGSIGGIGTLTVETGGTVNIGQELILRNAGTVNLQGGQINLVTSTGLIFSGGTFNFSFGTLHFTTSQAIGASGPIERALGGERRIRVGQHLEVDGTVTLNAPFQIDGGGLKADSLAVNGELLFSAGLLEVRGGPITGLTSLVVPASGELRTSGVHTFRVTGLAGSTITATGNLTLGSAAAVNGFATQGTLQVGAQTVTLLDANDAVLDSLSLATLGAGGSPGTLAAANGLTLNFGGNITGFGTVSTPNDITKPLINNGHITGDSVASPITLTGYVKGAGTLDNVNISGTFAPGLSPTILVAGNVAFSPTSTLVMELGGTAPGSGYDQILSTGALALDGALVATLINGFTPSAGQSFNLFDWMTASGTFDILQLPALAGGLAWDTSGLYTLGLLSVVSAAGLPGDYNANGTVDAADYVAWRKGGPLANEVDTPGTVNAADYTAWRARFGNTGGSGAGASAAVPEPANRVLIISALVVLISCRRQTLNSYEKAT